MTMADDADDLQRRARALEMAARRCRSDEHSDPEAWAVEPMSLSDAQESWNRYMESIGSREPRPSTAELRQRKKHPPPDIAEAAATNSTTVAATAAIALSCGKPSASTSVRTVGFSSAMRLAACRPCAFEWNNGESAAQA